MQAKRVVEVSHTEQPGGFARACGNGETSPSAVVRWDPAVRVGRPPGRPGVAP